MNKKHSATNPSVDLLGLDAPQAWDTELAFAHLQARGEADTKRTAERRLNALGLMPQELGPDLLLDERDRSSNRLVLDWAIEQARKRRDRVLFAQICQLPTGQACLHANDARRARFWVPLTQVTDETIQQAVADLQRHIGKPIAVYPHGALVGHLRQAKSTTDIQLCPQAYRPVLPAGLSLNGNAKPDLASSPHLKRLEAESIHIIREAVAEAQNPVMMYSIGKDSGVMLYLARKAFYPAPPPFPLLHIDTRWKFQEMYLFRDFMAHESGMDLLVHTNPEAIEKNINPFDHGSALHTDITKTEGLKQALDHYKFDVVFGGARRDEEKSRAKERVFSFRTSTHRWDPKNQRPELWNLYNTRKSPGESIRVFPLSNWTELDVWQYIARENIALPSIYYTHKREVVDRRGLLVPVTELTPPKDGEIVEVRNVRFRTVGDITCTCPVESNAATPEQIVIETLAADVSERGATRMDDKTSEASMEKRKKDGYF
jgi:sulfate adenylyltransferase subunit 2